VILVDTEIDKQLTNTNRIRVTCDLERIQPIISDYLFLLFYFLSILLYIHDEAGPGIFLFVTFSNGQTELIFLNVKGAQESIPRNRSRQPT
jgi:hypothetical protein